MTAYKIPALAADTAAINAPWCVLAKKIFITGTARPYFDSHPWRYFSECERSLSATVTIRSVFIRSGISRKYYVKFNL